MSEDLRVSKLAFDLLEKLDLDPNEANLDDAYHALDAAEARGAAAERARIVAWLNRCGGSRNARTLALHIERGDHSATKEGA